MKKRSELILLELKNHAPFTLFGALTGIVCMLIFKNIGAENNLRLFQVFHPTHVVLSAMVTSSIYMMYKKKASFISLLIIGYIGAIGVATVSDCVLPFFGESLLGVAIPTHAHSDEAEADHEHEDSEHTEIHADEQEHETVAIHEEQAHIDTNEHEHKGPHIHLGFIEEWYLVNPAAILGVLIAFFLPKTKFPHAGHVLISTWASSFHVLMNTRTDFTPLMLAGMIIVLFIAVWLPCCVSDIIFPLLFVKPGEEIKCCHH